MEEQATHDQVALYTSAWIEIPAYQAMTRASMVALYTSAWIEIALIEVQSWNNRMSHSTRVRGLKLKSC